MEEQVLAPSSGATWRAELVTAFELHHTIAEAVTAARGAGEVPLVLLLTLVVTLLLSELVHRLVEEPVRRLSARVRG